MISFKYNLLLLVIILISVVPERIQSQKHFSASRVKKAIRKFTSDTILRPASISFSLMDLQSGKLIVSYDPHRALIPASSQKIISSALTLNLLSGDFKFNTPFYLKGQMAEDGLFVGDLVIVGSGDPSFGSDYFTELPKLNNIADTLYAILMQKGIKKISGKINVNNEFIKDVPENKEWLWYDLGNYYGAGCFSLNFAENQASISLSAALSDGGLCKMFRVLPESLSSFYTNKVIGKQQPIKEDVYVLGSSESCHQQVLGEWRCCNQDTIMIHSALARPGEIFTQLLKEALQKKGIYFEDKNSISTSNDELIYSYFSPALSDLVKRALNKSVNLYSECFLHQYGYKVNGNTDRNDALIKMNKTLSEILSFENSFVLIDGSGLSPKNLISSSGFVQFLKWIDENKTLVDFWKMIPDPAVQGPLVKWLKSNKRNTIKLHLKSGSMEGVRSYTGYIVIDDKPRYAMSLIVNHYTCSGEKMNERIAHFLNTFTGN